MINWLTQIAVFALGVLITGIAGNAAWDVLKVGYRWILPRVYGAITGFQKKAFDDVYRYASRYGRRDAAILITLSYTLAVFVVFMFLASDFIRHFDTQHRVYTPDDGLIYWALIGALAVVGLALLIFAYLTLRLTLLVASSLLVMDQFDRLLVLLGSEISVDEERMAKSRFVRITTREEYASLTTELVALGRSRGLEIPAWAIQPTPMGRKDVPNG